MHLLLQKSPLIEEECRGNRRMERLEALVNRYFVVSVTKWFRYQHSFVLSLGVSQNDSIVTSLYRVL